MSESSLIVAKPGKNASLYALHQMIVTRFPDGLSPWSKPELWYPHTTLLHSPTMNLNSLCQQMRKMFVPFSVRISRIEFSQVRPDGYDILDHINLLPV